MGVRRQYDLPAIVEVYCSEILAFMRGIQGLPTPRTILPLLEEYGCDIGLTFEHSFQCKIAVLGMHSITQ